MYKYLLCPEIVPYMFSELFGCVSYCTDFLIVLSVSQHVTIYNCLNTLKLSTFTYFHSRELVPSVLGNRWWLRIAQHIHTIQKYLMNPENRKLYKHYSHKYKNIYHNNCCLCIFKIPSNHFISAITQWFRSKKIICISFTYTFYFCLKKCKFYVYI